MVLVWFSSVSLYLICTFTAMLLLAMRTTAHFIQLVMYKGQHSHLLPENADNSLMLYLLYHFQFEFLLLLCLTCVYYCVLQIKKKYRKTNEFWSGAGAGVGYTGVEVENLITKRPTVEVSLDAANDMSTFHSKSWEFNHQTTNRGGLTGRS